MKFSLFLWIACLCTFMSVNSYSQNRIFSCACSIGDSAWKKGLESRIKELYARMVEDTPRLKKPGVDSYDPMSVRIRPSLHNNYLSYTANYVSRIEGVYDYENILQQGFSYQTDASVLDKLPFRLTVNGRFSNSRYFRNYVDFNLSLKDNNVASRLQNESKSSLLKKQARELEKLYTDKIKDLDKFRDSLEKNRMDECINLYIRSKEILANKDIYLDTLLVKNGEDSVWFARNYISFYENQSHYKDSLKLKVDSFTNKIKSNLDDVKEIFKVEQPDSKFLAEKVLKHSRDIKHFDTSLVKPDLNFLSGFKKLSLGKSMPSSSQLNFQNISINGINAEYQFSRSFVSLQAGLADLGFRDFVFNKAPKRLPGFVYSAGAGIGNRAKDYIMLSFFGGNRRNEYGEKSNIFGTSLATQFTRKHISLQGEIAQTSFPQNNRTTGKNLSWLRDNSNKAYSVAMYTNWDKLSLSASGYYKYYGINYYGFNSFRIDANNHLWGAEIDKSFFGRSLTLSASIKKNDYRNPYVTQVYDGSNTVRSFNATFRKTGYPMVSAGYIPSFQYVSINDTIYENSYQVLNLLVSHPYTIGTVSAVSGIVINRFMDGGAQKGYFYSNSTNIIFNQTFRFDKYTSGFNVSVLKNSIYTYTVFDGSLSAQLNGFLEARVGFKINNMTSGGSFSRLGGYGSIGGTIKNLGRLSVSADRNYYPDINHLLYGNTMGSMTFTTYFK